MYRLSEDLAKEILGRIKTAEIDNTIGSTTFLPKSLNSIGIIDPICAIGTAFNYIIESPKPILYQNLPFIPTTVQGYFLYKKEELQELQEPWEISKLFVDPTIEDPEDKIDVQDAAVVLPSDIEKLTAITINSMDQLIKKEPSIIDCLNLEK